LRGAVVSMTLLVMRVPGCCGVIAGEWPRVCRACRAERGTRG
jgi:hypothetical protein